MPNDAVIGLAGAVVGGVLTSGSNLVIERLRARARAIADSKTAEVELRTAARLLVNELTEATNRIEHAQTSWTYWPPERALAADSWTHYRSTLAKYGDETAWGFTETAYWVINDVNWVVRDRSRGSDPVLGAPAPVEPEDHLERAIAAIDAAIDRLTELPGVLGVEESGDERSGDSP